MIGKRIRIFGEVLFDQFPDGQQLLGGAPFNVAWHLHAFGQNVDFISRIGNDAEGTLIKQAMTDWGLSLENLQIDPHYATGKVQIAVIDGEPHYDILAHQAYDFIDKSLITDRSQPRDMIYHGSLALRHPCSALALDDVLSNHNSQVFVDVNLRSPWWQVEQINQRLDNANWAKLNSDELMQLYNMQGSLKNTLQLFRATHNLDALIVTFGEQGALAVNNHNEFFEVKPANTVSVVDTVGAGDAFSAVVLLGLQHDWPLALILERAQAFASAIVGRQGAIVQDLNLYQAFVHAWQLD
jgi:fructokinase